MQRHEKQTKTSAYQSNFKIKKRIIDLVKSADRDENGLLSSVRIPKQGYDSHLD